MLLAVGVARAADLVVLTEENWDEYALAGDDADAVLGDYVLRNDKITVVVGNYEFISGRSGSRNGHDFRGVIIDMATREVPVDRLESFRLGPLVRNTLSDLENGTARYTPDYAADFEPQHSEEVVLTLRPRSHYSYFCHEEIRYTLRDGDPYVHVAVEFRNDGKAPVKDEPYWIKRDRREAEAAIKAAEQAEKGDPDDELAGLLAEDDNGPLPNADLKRGETGPAPAPYSCKCVADESLKMLAVGTLRGSSMAGQLTWVYQPDLETAYGSWAANDKGHFDLVGKGTYVIERVLIPGRSLAEVSAVARELAAAAAPETHTVSYAVTDAAGPVTGATITAYKGKVLQGVARTDAQGRAALELPQGRYRFVTAAMGRPEVTAELLVGGPSEQAYTMAQPAMLTVRVTDADGQGMPCRVTLRGRAGTADPVLGPKDGIQLVGNSLHTADGTGSMTLLPGSYTARVSRGPEYDAVDLPLELTAGQTTPITATLRRVVDSRGWISVDLHSHTSISGVDSQGHSTASIEGHILRLLAEQIDFAPSVEHNRVFDYTPYIAALGAQDQLASCPGIGLTDGGRKYAYNHQLAFPIVHHPHWLDGGAIQRPQHCGQIEWLRSWGIELDIDNPWLAAHHPEDGYEKLIIVQQDDNKQATQHVKDYDLRSALFRNQDISTYWNDDRAHIKPFLRDSDGDGTLDRITYNFAQACDAWDIGDLSALLDPKAHTENDVLDWLETRRHGHRLVGVATSRSSYNTPGPNHIRSYVRSETDAPAEIQPIQVARAIKAGQVMMTTGPFLDFQVVADSTGGPGEQITATNPDIELRIRVQCPPWIQLDEVQILRDGKPAPELTFSRAKHPDRFAADVLTVDQRLPVTLTADRQYIAIVRGRTVGSERADHVAITNAIYVDLAADGYAPQDPKLDTVMSRMRLRRSLRSATEAPPGQVEITLLNTGDTPAKDRVTLHIVPADAATIVGNPDLAYNLAPGARTTFTVDIKLKGDSQLDAMLGDQPVALTLWVDRSGIAPGRAPSRLVIKADGAADTQMMMDDETQLSDDWQQ